MADTFKKIDKTFVLSTSGVNSYGFRLLTDGYLADKFQSNPIGFFMHNRDGGVLLKWDNVRVEGDQIVAEPVINLSHPRGQQTVDEINNGFLNAASMGRIVPLEFSDDPNLKLEGQTGITVTKWYNKECSLVDIPGNDESLSKLYDENDNEINLADFTNQHKKMKEIKLQITADLLKHLNLSDNPDGAALLKGISDLADKAVELEKTVGSLKTEKTGLETQVKDLKAAAVSKEVNDQLEQALTSGKITKELQTQLAADYKENPAGLKTLLGGMSAAASVTQQINNANLKAKDGKELKNLSWDELDKGGYLENLKAKDWETYSAKFKEKFGSEPNKKA
jgi:hypothetical protein